MMNSSAGSYEEVHGRVRAPLSSPTRQAYEILHWGYFLLPVVAGLDKFLNVLVRWDVYLAPRVSSLLPLPAPTFMAVVGVVEVCAGLLVAARPKIGGLVVAAWLWAIVANLLLSGRFFDIALRDFGLSLGALALARLAARR